MLAGTSLVDLNVESAGPSAALSTSTSISIAGSSDETFEITYTDPISLQLNTLGSGNLKLTSPNGATEVATYMGIVSGTAQNVTVEYAVAPPDGSWSSADDGNYTINLLANQVGNASVDAPAATLGSFSVDVPATVATPPTSVLASVPTVTTEAASVSLPVTYTGVAAPVAVSTIGTGNLTVTGPAGTLEIASADADSSANATTVGVTYTAAPAGGFTAADDGIYTVSLAGGQIADTAGNVSVAQVLGTFDVEIAGSTTTNPAATALALSIPAASVHSGNLVSLVANVTAGNGTVPAGSVAFYTGSALLGMAALSGGTATFATTAFTAGSNPVTAVYTGDTGYAAATSAAAAVTIIAPAAGTPALSSNVSRTVLPATLVAGAKHKIAVPVTVANTGSEIEKGTIKINLYASTGTTLDSMAVLLSSTSYRVSIKAGRSGTLTVHLTGLTIAAGTYHLLAQVVDAAGFAQTATTAGTVTVAAPFVSPVVTFAKTPKSVIAGKKTSAATLLRIANGGNVAITGKVTLTLYLSSDGTLATATEINSVVIRANIAAGKASNVAVSLKAIPSEFAGADYLIADFQTSATTTGAPAVSVTAGDPNPVMIVATAR